MTINLAAVQTLDGAPMRHGVHGCSARQGLTDLRSVDYGGNDPVMDDLSTLAGRLRYALRVKEMYARQLDAEIDSRGPIPSAKTIGKAFAKYQNRWLSIQNEAGNTQDKRLVCKKNRTGVQEWRIETREPTPDAVQGLQGYAGFGPIRGVPKCQSNFSPESGSANFEGGTRAETMQHPANPAPDMEAGEL